MLTEDPHYVLVTAAHNEETSIEETIQSVLGQSTPPLRWVIVNDASTDGTGRIIQHYVSKHTFISCVTLDQAHGYSFASKARAISAGFQTLHTLQFAFVGILDADISLPPHYYGDLIDRLLHDPTLGLTGGYIHELLSGTFLSRPGNRTWSVAGAAQLFRRECFADAGGIRPLKYGGEDWCAEVTARMKGWKVEAVSDLPVYHLRATGAVGGLLSYLFRQGRMDYSLGSLPGFEAAKCLSRLGRKPLLIGALARLSGFLWSYCIRDRREVTPDFISFLRREQKHRLLRTAALGPYNTPESVKRYSN